MRGGTIQESGGTIHIIKFGLGFKKYINQGGIFTNCNSDSKYQTLQNKLKKFEKKLQ